MASFRAQLLPSVWILHRWLGLGFGLLFLVISSTGGLLVVQREIEESVERRITVVTPREERAPLAALLANVQARAPVGLRARTLIVDPDPAHAWRIQLSSLPIRPRYQGSLDNHQMYAVVDPYTGQVIAFRDENRLLDRWIRTLHVTLFAGHVGVIATTLTAFALLLSGCSGVWIYRGALGGLWRHPFRANLGWRTAVGDLHRWIGVASLLFSLIWGATGAFMMVYSLPALFARATSASPPAPTSWTPRNSPAIERLIASAHTCFPTAELDSISLPLLPNDPITVSLIQRSAPVWAKFPSVDFDAATGRQLRVNHPSTATFFSKLQSAIKPLHFGYFGSVWVKYIYFALAWAPALLFVTGLSLWWMSRRVRKPRLSRPTP
jgi:uncharacterized iron-regulated membrane protein